MHGSITPNAKIEDAGDKLGGARKDMAAAVNDSRSGNGPDLLETLWPKPGQWTDLIPSVGAHRAALIMVTYENLATKPHRNGWLRVSASDWERAYRFAIPVIRDVLMQPGKFNLNDLSDEFNQRMQACESLCSTSPRFANQWSYAIGRAGSRTNRHPLSFTPIDGLRAKYLGEWGWGTDPRVSSSLAMGALSVKENATGRRYWMSVKGASGKWEHLDQLEFDSEASAIENTRLAVNILLATPKEPGARRKPGNNWIRPRIPGNDVRSGFASPNSAGRSELELIETFGFRGVEFGNWVSQADRQTFVDAAYDAFLDLVQLLGMPPSFASLSGRLGIAYGSRGHGLTHAAAHFVPDNWVLHFTKESGFGTLSHEFGHAFDAWVATYLWGNEPLYSGFASTEWHMRHINAVESHGELIAALSQWGKATTLYNRNIKWVTLSKEMDRRRKTPYWSDKCELFARGFEVLVTESFKSKNRHNDMLVYGISEQDGQQAAASGNPFPYPVGPERQSVCAAMASLIRAYRNAYRASCG